MIYVSSSCLKSEKISETIEVFAQNGFLNIELSGGSAYYDDLEQDLIKLKERYGLNYLLHNYFPPPKEDFMLNLGSLNDDVYAKSLEHYRKAILLSEKLKAEKFGIHAGYFMDFNHEEAGKAISLKPLCDKKVSIKRFCDGFKQLSHVSRSVELYVENNVLSQENYKTFKEQNPFMMMDSEGFEELGQSITFKLLLDVAHLKVSSRTLNLDFSEQLKNLIPKSDYIHFSDNDALQDQNKGLDKDCDFFDELGAYDWDRKTVTLEVYGDMSEIKASYAALKEALNLT